MRLQGHGGKWLVNTRAFFVKKVGVPALVPGVYGVMVTHKACLDHCKVATDAE